jgi:hypothetical protein
MIEICCSSMSHQVGGSLGSCDWKFGNTLA